MFSCKYKLSPVALWSFRRLGCFQICFLIVPSSFTNSLKQNSVFKISYLSYLQISGYVCAAIHDLNVFESLFWNISCGRRNSVKVRFSFKAVTFPMWFRPLRFQAGSSLAVWGKPEEVMVNYCNHFHLFSWHSLNLDLGIAMNCLQVDTYLCVRNGLLLHCCLLWVCTLLRMACGCEKLIFSATPWSTNNEKFKPELMSWGKYLYRTLPGSTGIRMSPKSICQNDDREETDWS